MKYVIEMENVSKVYRNGSEVTALKNVDLKVKKGEFFMIVGPSGSGKSTMLHLMGALDKPTEGTVRIMGNDITKMSDTELSKVRRELIGFVFQQFNLIQSLTVLENVMFPMALAGRADREKAVNIIVSCGLEEEHLDKFPSQLSGGEQQRAAIARALANDPEVLLADEPTGQLDSRNTRRIMELFKSINDEGNTVVVVTHDISLVSWSDRTVVLQDGQITAEVKNPSPSDVAELVSG